MKKAARSIPINEIPNNRVNQVYVIILIASLGLGTTYLFLLKPTPLPAWIIAERSSTQKPMDAFIEVEEQDISKYPELVKVIQQADWASRPGSITTPPGLMVKMTHEKGRELIAFLGGDYKNTVKTYFFKIRLNENLYRIRIEFSEKPPIQL